MADNSRNIRYRAHVAPGWGLVGACEGIGCAEGVV